jgi:hypothetical protein
VEFANADSVRTITVSYTGILPDLFREGQGVVAEGKLDAAGRFLADTVLAGLSQPLPALSFEFTTIQRDVALACLDRLASLGAYGFDVALGESQQLAFGRWISRADMAAHLAALPHEANSGDVYCVLQS